jgi:pimeloyl-ACP methyl ester carboxylesterase
MSLPWSMPPTSHLWRLPLATLVACVFLGGSGCAAPAPRAEPETDERDTRELVVLVHGMGRTPLSMSLLAGDLEHAGYRVLNWGYSSTCCTVAELGDQLHQAVIAGSGGAERVHFVGHSLGNIIIRAVLSRQDPLPPVGRVVMLAPPNQGSHTADRYARWLGDVLKPLPELTTDTASAVRRLSLPAGVQVGIIAGEYDGKVTIDETRLNGTEAHAIVPGAHTFIMARPDARRLVLAFLRSGSFPPMPAGQSAPQRGAPATAPTPAS